jgi:predicted CopG family antitoxin
MTRKTITISDEIYEKVKDVENFSELVSTLLAKYNREQSIEAAKKLFGSIPDFMGMDGVEYVNKMRADDTRPYVYWGESE